MFGKPDHASIQPFSDESDADAQLLKAAVAGNQAVLREWTARLRGATDVVARLTRAFLAAISEAPVESLRLLLESELVDLEAQDDINERNALHEAAMAGQEPIVDIALARGIDVCREDAYGRTPLHYACAHGNVSVVTRLLRADPKSIDRPDHDHFTPLIHSIMHHHLECVEQLLNHGAQINPRQESDHVPLNLSCQYGSLNIARRLLQAGALITADAEGLFPQHLVARKGGSPNILLVLRDYGADIDQPDRIDQWTPLFHAASEGCVNCVQILIENHANVNVLDERGHSAMYYATWEGHLSCMQLISKARGDFPLAGTLVGTQHARLTPRAQPNPKETDGIPSLALPPPFIPLRRYGHNFLERKALIQITLEARNSDAVKFYHSKQHPAAQLTISSKSSELIPRTITLPVTDEVRTMSFQVDDLDAFSVNFDVYPTFGARIIARTVALPTVFDAATSSSGRCCLPLFDPRLRAVGQLSFRFHVIKPFDRIPQEIAPSETYWKSTSLLDSEPSTKVTGSSLSGGYVRLYVQLTADGIPILFPKWCIDFHGVACPVGRLTLSELERMSGSVEREASSTLRKLVDPSTVFLELHGRLSTLQMALSSLHPDMRVDIHVLYPSPAEEQFLGLGPALQINAFADAVLRVVFNHTRAMREQGVQASVVFTSSNPDLCTALNWKQPSCKCRFQLFQ